MADLNRDRGQIILITGFVLAVTFVALALILNSVIFTENLATRSESVGGPGPVETRDVVGDAVGDLMAFANANNGSDEDEQVEEIRNATASLGPAVGAQFGLQGQSVDVTYLNETNGTRYVQNKSVDEFRSSSGDENWTVVKDTTNVTSGANKTHRIRDFVFNVSREKLANVSTSNCPWGGDCFRVNVTSASGSGLWGVAIYRSGTDEVVVESYDGSGYGSSVIGTCRIPGKIVRISLSTGRVGNASAIQVEDSQCQAINFASSVGSPYNVTFWNGGEAVGTYSLITSRNRDLSPGALPTGLINGPSSSDSPRATHAVYETFVRANYVVNSAEYNATVRVAPGEPR